MSRARVLLADDEEPYQISIGDFLKSRYEVDIVSDAAGIKEKGPGADILVVDVHLLNYAGEGIDAVGDLLRGNHISPTVPIIFISIEPASGALPSAKRKSNALPDGRWVWLQKPCELTTLARMIVDEQARLRPARGSRPA